MTPNYALAEYVQDLRSITASSRDEGEIIERVCPLAARLAADKSWLQRAHYTTDAEQGFGVHLLHEEADHSLAVLAISWQPGRGTPPHDHGTWAVVVGVEGVERNVRYRRLDDGSRDDYAELEVKHEFDAPVGEPVAIKSGGIHKVTNETDQLTLSLHTYGRHINYSNRSQFDLASRRRQSYLVRVE